MKDLKLKKHPGTGKLIPEEWKPVDGYDGWYEISNYGRIRSWHNQGHGKRENPKILKSTPGSTGYKKVELYKDGSGEYYHIHRLVAEHFILNTDNKRCVNHKDGIKTNDFYLNLEWCTYSENNKHARDTGLNSLSGESNGRSKLRREDILKIRELHDSGEYTAAEISEMVGISLSQANKIGNRKTWTHI